MSNPWDQDWSGKAAPPGAAPWEVDWSGKGKGYKKPAGDGQMVSGFKRSFEEVPGMLAGVGAFGADLVGATETRDALLGYAKRKQEEVGAAHAGDAQSITDTWDGKTGWLDFLANASGYVAGQALQSIATGGLGAFGAKMLASQGAKQVAEAAAAKAIAGGATEAAAQAAAAEALAAATTKAMTRGAAAGAGAQNMNMELGSIYPDAVEEAGGADNLDGGDKFRVFAAASLAAGVDTLGEAINASRVLKGSKAGQAIGADGMVKPGPGMLGRAAREVPAGMAREAGTEGVQTVLEQYGAAKTIGDAESIKDIVDSMGVGAVGGGLAGGIAARKAREPDPVVPPAAKPGSDPLAPEAVAAVLGASTLDDAIKAAANATTTALTRPRAEVSPLAAEIRALEDPQDRQEALGLVATAQNPNASGPVRRFAQNRLDELLLPIRQIPVGEATEVPLIPTGEAQELTSTEATSQILEPPTFDQRRAMGKRLPTGKATEITPEDIELGQIPVGEAIEVGGSRPEGMPERSRTDGQPIDPTGPNAVAAYIQRLQGVNTPAARAFVQDFAAGRITRDDVMGLLGANPPKAEPTADERLAAAAGQKQQILPTDFLTQDGQPYGSRTAAGIRAKKEEGTVVPVEGGWVVRKEPAGEQSDLPVPAGVAVPAADGAGDQPGGSVPAVRPVAAPGPAGEVQAGVPAAAGRGQADQPAAGSGSERDGALTPASTGILGVPQAVGGRDPRTITFTRRDNDGRLTRLIEYPDGERSEEFLVTDKNGDEHWVSSDRYNKGNYFPVKTTPESAAARAADELPSAAPAPAPAPPPASLPDKIKAKKAAAAPPASDQQVPAVGDSVSVDSGPLRGTIRTLLGGNDADGWLVSDTLQGSVRVNKVRFHRKMDAPAAAPAAAPTPAQRPFAQVVSNEATNPGEYLVREGGSNLARFQIGAGGKPTKIKYFYDSEQTRDWVRKSMDAHFAKSASPAPAAAPKAAPGTRLNGAAEKAAADRLEKLAESFYPKDANSPEGAARMSLRSIAAELRKERTVTSVEAILEQAAQRLDRQFSAQADVVREVLDSLRGQSAPAAAPSPAPKPDKAEIRPFRRADGSIGYEAVPIVAPAPAAAQPAPAPAPVADPATTAAPADDLTLDDELNDALGKLGDVLGDVFGAKKNITGPQYGAADLLPALSKVVELLVRKGFVSFRGAVGKAAQVMRANAATAPHVDAISARQWKAAYNAIADAYPGADTEEALGAMSAADVLAIVAPPAAVVEFPADALAKAKAAGQAATVGVFDWTSKQATRASVQTAVMESLLESFPAGTDAEKVSAQITQELAAAPQTLPEKIRAKKADETPAETPAADPEGLVVIPADPKVFAEALTDMAGASNQADGESQRMRATFTPDTKPVSLPRVTGSNTKPAGVEFMSPEQAAAKLAEWKAEADRQGTKLAGPNSNRVVLSLFDASGVLAQPWYEAGYRVFTYDLQTGGDIAAFNAENLLETHGNDEIFAILAQPPCTDFASSGAQWWKDKDADGRTEASNELVKQVLRTVELFRPPVWVMENPVGRIATQNNLPTPLLSMDPWHFGDPYSKRTLLWGKFDPNLPTAMVEPTEGSKIHRMSSSAKYERSLTSEPFAYALFMANNADAMGPAGRLAAEFAGVERKLFDAAVANGKAEYDIRSAIEDSYYENDLETVREILADLGGQPAPATTATDKAAPAAAVRNEAVIDLRKRLSVLNALRTCLG
jgi:hypothetical protein